MSAFSLVQPLDLFQADTVPVDDLVDLQVEQLA
jgi:hypothetical protein